MKKKLFAAFVFFIISNAYADCPTPKIACIMPAQGVQCVTQPLQGSFYSKGHSLKCDIYSGGQKLSCSDLATRCNEQYSQCRGNCQVSVDGPIWLQSCSSCTSVN